MKTINGRIRKLEDRLRPTDEKRGNLLVVCLVGWGLALDQDRCLQILDECGFLRTGPRLGLVNLCQIPGGLSAEELERYLRENGAETRGFHSSQDHGEAKFSSCDSLRHGDRRPIESLAQ